MQKPHGKGFGPRLLEASVAQLDADLLISIPATLPCVMPCPGSPVDT